MFNGQGNLEKWDEFFFSLSERELQAVALLRVIECTNGCIQHLFRDGHPKALPIEQTRAAMQFSMGLMKSLKVEVGSFEHTFEAKTEEKLREIRDLYIRAFKQGDGGAEEEFFVASRACVNALGHDRILKAADLVKGALSDILPSHSVDWGVLYLTNLLNPVN